MRAPPNGRRRPRARDGADTQQNTATNGPPIIADARGGVVVDLGEARLRRLVADLGLGPTVPVPCSGTCWCYGRPLGGSA
jgi:hypothetical protein